VFRQAQQPPKRLLKNIDLICAKLPAEKKTNFTLTKTTIGVNEIYRQTETLVEKG
jgi:hypothetical protein